MLPNQDPRFNPDGSPSRRHQLRILSIMEEVDAICRRHQLRYWLCSGTLLGAVRHGGFIPWDDDIDIEMPMADYKRLLQILPHELPPHLALQTPATDPGYFFTFAKVRDLRSRMSEPHHYDRIFNLQGVFIDIFPIERSNRLCHWIAMRTHGFCYKVMKNPRNTDADCRRKVRRILRWNERLVFPLLRALGKLLPSTPFYSLGVPYPLERKDSYVYPLKDIEFEGRRFLGPNDPHAFLSAQFGDYMQLPNLDQLHPHTESLNLDCQE